MVNKNVLKAETKADAINYFAKKFDSNQKTIQVVTKSVNVARHHSRERSYDSQDSIKISEGSLAYHNKLVKRGGRQPDTRQTFLDFVSSAAEFQTQEQKKQRIHKEATE